MPYPPSSPGYHKSLFTCRREFPIIFYLYFHHIINHPFMKLSNYKMPFPPSVSTNLCDFSVAKTNNAYTIGTMEMGQRWGEGGVCLDKLIYIQVLIMPAVTMISCSDEQLWTFHQNTLILYKKVTATGFELHCIISSVG